MNWKITRHSNALDEIRLVYEKAEGNTSAAQLLAELEDGALAEIRNCKDFCKVDGKALTPEEVDALPDGTKERLIVALANVGLEALSLDKGNPSHLIARLSPRIQSVLHCTAFSLLNRMEKLDGSLNVLFPKVTLEVQAPLGGEKGAALHRNADLHAVSLAQRAGGLHQRRSGITLEQPDPCSRSNVKSDTASSSQTSQNERAGT